MNNISKKEFSRILIIGGIFVMCLSFMCCCFIGNAAADPQLVDGYYQITSTDDLTWFANQVNAGHVTYNAKLMVDIDLSSISSWNPIGTSSNKYAGTFDGNGHTISGLRDIFVYSSSSTGLLKNTKFLSCTVDKSDIQFAYFLDIVSENCVFKDITVRNTKDVYLFAYVNNKLARNCIFDSCVSVSTGGNSYAYITNSAQNCYVINCNCSAIGFSSADVIALSSAFFGESSNSAVISISLTSSGDSGGDLADGKAPICAKWEREVPITNCYASNTIQSYKSSKFGDKIYLYNGNLLDTSTFYRENFYHGGNYLNWDFTNTWYWDSVNNLPKLRAFIQTPPTISSITDPASPVTINTAITSTVTASPTISGDSLTYKWQVNTGSTWADISEQTTNTLSYTPLVAGTYQFRCIVTESKIGSGLSATSNTVSCVAIIPYVDPIPNTPGAPIQPIPIPYTITLTASCINEDQVQSYVWQLQSGGNWNNVSTSQQYEPVISVAGNYVYRFIAIGKNGNSIPSTSVTVNAGYKPSAVISSPETGTLFNAGELINLVATVGGTTASYTWNFGNDVIEHGTQSGTINSQSETITSYVKYNQQKKGGKTITLTVTNIYDTAAIYTITIVNGASSIRPAATSTLKPVDASGIYNMINHTNPMSANNSMPNLSGMVSDLTKPITSIIGEWFYLIIFAVPYLIIFIRQKNLLIPSILGVMFAAFLFVMLPGVAMRAAIGILVLSIAGGIFGLYVKRQS